MHLRYTAWLVLSSMTATLAACNKVTAPNQVISETAPVAQSGSVAQSAALAQSGAVVQSGAIAQSGPIAQSETPSAPDPSYPDLIADRLKTTFKDYASYELFEISTPRWVHSFQGWNWLVCVRFLDRGRRRSYALLFNSSKVLDSHYAYQTDNCGIESYVVFEQMRGLGLPPLH
jgi:hypothetical protein